MDPEKKDTGLKEPQAKVKKTGVLDRLRRIDLDDKDVAMVGIVILCVVGGYILLWTDAADAIIGGLFTGGITALGSLASGRNKQEK